MHCEYHGDSKNDGGQVEYFISNKNGSASVSRQVYADNSVHALSLWLAAVTRGPVLSIPWQMPGFRSLEFYSSELLHTKTCTS